MSDGAMPPPVPSICSVFDIQESPSNTTSLASPLPRSACSMAAAMPPADPAAPAAPVAALPAEPPLPAAILEEELPAAPLPAAAAEWPAALAEVEPAAPLPAAAADWPAVLALLPAAALGVLELLPLLPLLPALPLGAADLLPPAAVLPVVVVPVVGAERPACGALLLLPAPPLVVWVDAGGVLVAPLSINIVSSPPFEHAAQPSNTSAFQSNPRAIFTLPPSCRVLAWALPLRQGWRTLQLTGADDRSIIASCSTPLFRDRSAIKTRATDYYVKANPHLQPSNAGADVCDVHAR